jgi:hypothetical protein
LCVAVAALALEPGDFATLVGLGLPFAAWALGGLFVEFPEYVGVFAGDGCFSFGYCQGYCCSGYCRACDSYLG